MTRRIAKIVFATDHRTVGVLYLLLGVVFMGVGGMLAMLMRWQLGWPGADVPVLGALMRGAGVWPSGAVPPEVYARLFTLHGTVMIFFVVVPLLVHGLGTYLIPLKIGATRMAFPRASGLAVWMTVVAGVVLMSGVLLPGGAAASGWTSYTPLSSIPTSRGDWPMVPTLCVALAWFVFFLHAAGARKTPEENSDETAQPNETSATPGPDETTLKPARSILRPVALASLALVSACVATLITRWLAFDGQSTWFVGLVLLSLANIAQAINFLTTITLRRCSGMTFLRLPLSVWALFFTAFMMLLSTPVFIVALSLNLSDHHGLTRFFVAGIGAAPGSAGQPLLWQHLFWFYSHPVVYIMILPAMGMVSDILAVFSRKPVFGYRAMVWSSGLIALLGFVVWAHHMYQSGLNPALSTGFALATFLIAVPSGVKVFNWIGTIWRGSLRLVAPMLHAIGFVSLFVIGGLSGVLLASPAVNVHLHDTYFVVAHIHYVLFGGSLFGIFAAVTFWWPLFTGKLMSERWNKIHFALTYVLFNSTFLAMHALGLRGLPRRVADPSLYESFADLMSLNRYVSTSAFLLGASQLILLGNMLWSLKKGQKAPENPWQATTLEWQPGAPARVWRGPYEYNSPLAVDGKDWIGQGEDLRVKTGASHE